MVVGIVVVDTSPTALRVARQEQRERDERSTDGDAQPQAARSEAAATRSTSDG